MKRALLILFAMVVFVGCNNTQEPAETPITTTAQDLAEEVIIKAIVQEWVDAGMPRGDDDQPAWYSGYNIGDDDAPSKVGDDDGPNHPRTACSVQGMPRCKNIGDGFDKCQDMCGNYFYVVEYSPGETICVSTYGAYVYTCNGSNY